MKRKMFKQVTALALAAMMTIGSSVLVSAKEFPDVKESDWFYNAVSTWSNDSYNVLVGDGNGYFNPHAAMTFAELATVLSKTFGYTEKAEIPEAYQNRWYSDAIAKAIAVDVIPADVEPLKALSREEAVAVVARAFDIAPLAGETSFADNAEISEEYVGYVAAFQKAKFVAGTGNNVFSPKVGFTRAQIMQILDNILADITDADMTDKVIDGSLIIRKEDTTLTDVTVNGDLIVGQGVGDGDVTLDNVVVKGRLVVNGGGSNSIIIKGGSQIAYAVINKTGGEAANLRIDGDSVVTALEVNSGKAARVTGNVSEVQVSANATLDLAEGSMVEKVVIDGEKVTIFVHDGATAKKITIEGDEVSIQGVGRVEAVTVAAGSSNVEVGTRGTTITNNGVDAVKTETGEVPSGETVTTEGEASTPPSYVVPPASSGSTPTPQPTTVTVNSLNELRAALGNANITTIHVPIGLHNTDADITIPAGKTVVLGNGGSLRLRDLTINGSLIGNGNGGSWAYVLLWGSLSGSGLNSDMTNGFVGTTAAYTAYSWRWRTTADGVATTGWWPSAVTVDSQAGLSDAVAVSTISEIQIVDDFEIENDCTVDSLHIYADVTIKNGVTVSPGFVRLRGSVTGAGTLAGVDSNTEIYLVGDSEINISGINYIGPAATNLPNSFVRVIPWTGSAWGTPYLL